MKFSIITVNLNNLEGLKRTINSVAPQTYKDYEWIIIDGGSSDGSKELIKLHKQLFSFWCSEPDDGVYDAMNKGIAHAEGDYLLFLNSGDELYDNNVLFKIANLNSEADIISGQVVRMDNHHLLRSYDNNMLIQLWRDTLNHQGTFIKRNLFNYTLYDVSYQIVSDWKFWWETLVFKNASYEIVDIVVARQDMNGISSSRPVRNEREKVKNEIIPRHFQNMLNDYDRNYVYITRANYLFSTNKTLYTLGSKLLSFLVKMMRII